MRKEHQAAIIALTALTWSVMTVWTGFPSTWVAALKPFLTALTVSGFSVFLFEKFYWSLAIFHGNLTRQPNLKGVWKVTIHSTWKDPVTQVRISPISGYAEIDQTFSTFSLRIYTETSHSSSSAFSFLMDHNVYLLSVVYENCPNIFERQEGSLQHFGCVQFKLRGRNPDKFEGEYFTESETNGTISLCSRKRGVINSFQNGAQLYQQGGE